MGGEKVGSWLILEAQLKEARMILVKMITMGKEMEG